MFAKEMKIYRITNVLHDSACSYLSVSTKKIEKSNLLSDFSVQQKTSI